MKKQSPVQRIWELGKDEHGKLITAVLMAVGEDNLPTAVTLSGEASPYARRQIQAIIANDLGISKENQKWIG